MFNCVLYFQSQNNTSAKKNWKDNYIGYISPNIFLKESIEFDKYAPAIDLQEDCPCAKKRKEKKHKEIEKKIYDTKAGTITFDPTVGFEVPINDSKENLTNYYILFRDKGENKKIFMKNRAFFREVVTQNKVYYVFYVISKNSRIQRDENKNLSYSRISIKTFMFTHFDENEKEINSNNLYFETHDPKTKRKTKYFLYQIKKMDHSSANHCNSGAIKTLNVDIIKGLTLKQKLELPLMKKQLLEYINN